MPLRATYTRRETLRLMTGVAALPLLGAPARAKVVVDITGAFQPSPIAIPDFLGDPQLGKDVAQIITKNLTRSGYFQVLPQQSYIEKFTSVDTTPNFQSWKAINAQLVLVGSVTRGGQGLTAQFRLWDVFGGNQQEGKQFTTTAENWRRLAHILSDAVYSSVTGLGGYFDSRVVFVDETGPKDKRVKRLAIMDQDSANLRYLTSNGPLVLTPRFSPASNQIVYMQFGTEDPRVYLFDLQSGARQNLGSFPGMSFSPRFAPDGRRVIMSVLNQDGNSSIALMDLGSRNISKLTSGPQIDTAASFSPDGANIVFESDRGGGQQLYVMGAGGGGPNRISFGEGRYATPVWSPRGDYIAFTKQSKDGFSVGVIKPDGSGERILHTDFHAEGPSWSPNGQVIMFFKERGGPKLWTIDVSGRFLQQVDTPNLASDPAWSPLLT